MGQQIVFKNNQNVSYCQLKYSDSKRIFISVAEGLVKISTLKWFGTLPDKLIGQFSVSDLFENPLYQEVVTYLNTNRRGDPDFSEESRKYGFNQLDVFRELLIRCENLEEVKRTLHELENS